MKPDPPSIDKESIIPYDVIEVSSEDFEHPASHLCDDMEERHIGWQTEPNPNYPQHIIVRAGRNIDTTVNVTKMDILIHESKIPKRIEIFTASKIDDSKSEEKMMEFTRLGYVSLDSNEESGYKTRELKSVPLDDVTVQFIKLVVHECYDVSNSVLNPHRQVGIVALTLFGKLNDVKSPLKSVMNDEVNVEYQNATPIKSDLSEDVSSKRIPKDSQVTKDTPTPYSINHRKDEKTKMLDTIQDRIEILEKKKLERAEDEDYDTAAKIKDALLKIRQHLDGYHKYQTEMRTAAANEDYVEASRLKCKRDGANKAISDLLQKLESEMMMATNKGRNVGKHSCDRSLQNLSLSIIPSSGEICDSSLAMSLASKENQNIFDESVHDQPHVVRNINRRAMNDNVNNEVVSKNQLHFQNHDNLVSSPSRNRDESSTALEDDKIYMKHDDNNINETIDFENEEHPLKGVPGYETLPTPEPLLINTNHKNINDGPYGGSTPSILPSTNLDLSIDSISKVESFLGSYLMRCYLSKNWSLREAALIKTSLILPGYVQGLEKSNIGARNDDANGGLLSLDNHDNWWQSVSRVMCILLERAIDDNIVQVFLTGLILLDDWITQLEYLNLSARDVITSLGNIVPNLIGKLSQNGTNTKITEGIELTLVSLSLSSAVGPSYIGTQSLKQFSPSEIKSVKSLCARFRLIKCLVEEFGEEGPSCRKVMDLLKSCGVSHKDSEVRDVSRELSTILYVRDGSIVLNMLEGVLTDRQLKEYKLSFSAAMKSIRSSMGSNSDGNTITSGENRKISRSDCDSRSIQNVTNIGSIASNEMLLRNDDHRGVIRTSNHQTKSSSVVSGMENLGLGDVVPISRRGRGRGRGRIIQSL